MFLLPVITRDALGRDLFAAATYVSNYLFAWWENDYQNLDATPSPFIHYWSLAVEEQFYLIWPIFILFLSKYGKRAIFYGIAVSSALSLMCLSIKHKPHPSGLSTHFLPEHGNSDSAHYFFLCHQLSGKTDSCHG